MDHYLEIKVLPDPEFEVATLFNALFAKLHRALADVGQGQIGVSFPLADKTLGPILRLHGKHAALEQLMAENWLKGLRDYTTASVILSVPASAKHRVVKRVQAKSSAERLRRRSISKGWLSEQEAIERIPLANEARLKLPFIQMKSNSTAQSFRLFIQQGPLQAEAVAGVFNDYGLSPVATIPVF
ncbi:type I-F CRISPR-associated endoribonuclease Cas6/Csy4 [Iodobacter sp.]|uniref:type I-F CRISPR-associated endoribonuclease Cas6/Csy4 n=1 Tax=Iodobacter sp. TaxID=1915058 RepID=UPI0025F5D432|nr:type I-F CRISPR-associated endoribonuclease Cas6/Csy4 [Iodobacter sp.]